MLRILWLIFFMQTINSAWVDKAAFWNTRQEGTNIFNAHITHKDIQAAKAYGLSFIRLSPDKFLSDKDFLLGDTNNYKGLNPKDLQKLINVLDICHQENMPVVITFLSLPGSRWKQNNQGQDDLKLWEDEAYQKQAALFWKDLAEVLKDHPAIVGYNLLNEPHPERLFKPDSLHIHDVHQEIIQKKMYNFYDRLIKHIRQVDTKTPLILDSSAYADPRTFQYLIPHNDKNILYSFHMYEPYAYTNYKMNKERLSYPGYIHKKLWNKDALYQHMKEVIAFQKKYAIPSHRIMVGEFGGHRLSRGLKLYFKDLISIFKQEGWHTAFYAFREDTWDGMDYELGTQKLPYAYWQALERGDQPSLHREYTPVFKVITENLKSLT